MNSSTWSAYCRLMRIDKPIGILLLLWPTLWALWLASHGMPTVSILMIFIAGVFLMRSAGCVVNDYIDRQVDGQVKRTRQRPLPQGEVTAKEAKILFCILLSLAFILVLTLNLLTVLLAVIAGFLTLLYPFMKRVTHLPQLVLGLAFSWSIPMAYAAVLERLPLNCWLLLLANFCWIVAYDTQYAMVDREDDVKIGIKSTAILFGRFDKLIIGILQFSMLFIITLVGYRQALSGAYYWSVLLAGVLFIHQQQLMDAREPDACFSAFLNNNYVGLVLFIGIVLGLH